MNVNDYSKRTAGDEARHTKPILRKLPISPIGISAKDYTAEENRPPDITKIEDAIETIRNKKNEIIKNKNQIINRYNRLRDDISEQMDKIKSEHPNKEDPERKNLLKPLKEKEKKINESRTHDSLLKTLHNNLEDKRHEEVELIKEKMGLEKLANDKSSFIEDIITLIETKEYSSRHEESMPHEPINYVKIGLKAEKIIEKLITSHSLSTYYSDLFHGELKKQISDKFEANKTDFIELQITLIERQARNLRYLAGASDRKIDYLTIGRKVEKQIDKLIPESNQDSYLDELEKQINAKLRP